MGTKKKFIVKFGITVFLLAILLWEGLFLYCRYVEHTSASQYAAEKLHIARKWISHSGAQTANAKTPAGRNLSAVESAPLKKLPFPTAEDALQAALENLGTVIPENRHTVVSSNLRVAADPAYPSQDDEEKEGANNDKDKKEERAAALPPEEAQAEVKPVKAASANSAGTDTAGIRDLLDRQTKAGIKPNADSRVQLDAEAILQNPELPTGCEVTSLTMALRFAGYDVSKEELADQYLDKASPGTVSYKTAFWGDPRQPDSFGCYAPVIVNAANKYLDSQESAQTAWNLTGAHLDDLLAEVRMGYPVIVWGSMYIDEEIVFSYGWDIEGETVTWPSNEHCMLLIGFNVEEDSVIVCDPLSGIVSYDKAAFQRHYDTLEQQAIVIY